MNGSGYSVPLVSVILPVYNSSDFIFDSLSSILNQSLKDFELIIINDGSTDNSENIILNFNDYRIKYLKNEKNIGLVNTLNIGIEFASGKYIARMDSDDIAHPLRLQSQVKFLEENEKIGIVGSFVQIITSKGTNSYRGFELPIDNRNIKTYLFFHNPFVHPSVLIRADILKNFTYSNDFTLAEDYFLWVKILEIYNGFNISSKLLNYRIHSNNVSSKNKQIQNQSLYKIYSYLLSKYFVTDLEKMTDLHFKFCVQNNEINISASDYKEIEKYILIFHDKVISDGFEKFYLEVLLKINWLNLSKFTIFTHKKLIFYFFNSDINKLLKVNLFDKIRVIFYVIAKTFYLKFKLILNKIIFFNKNL